MKQHSSSQLALAVQLPDDETFSSFYPGSNQQLISELKSVAASSSPAFYYIWGHHGAGRTHLLHATCGEINQRDGTSVFIPLSRVMSMGTAVLEGLEQLDLICLDDLQEVIGDPQWEEAIFDLFNRWNERGEQRGMLIVTASSAPRNLGIKLADLASRLDWGTSYQLNELSDEEKLAALQLRAEIRGFHLTEDVGHFLLKRLSRDMSTLVETLDQLDNASLHARRKITIPFVKEILEL